MKEAWGGILSDDVRTAAAAAGTGAGIGGASGLLRVILLNKNGGWTAYLSILSASVMVGVLTGLVSSSVLIDGTHLSLATQWASIIIASIVSNDLLTGLRNLGTEFASDPLALVQRLWGAFRGR